MIRKIISGGQTGVDQAALDVAIKLGIPHGGWIPKGRLTEAGPLPRKYKLQELPTRSYPKRTERNVLDSDATLVIARGAIKGGTALTLSLARRHGKPFLQVDLARLNALEAARCISHWVLNHQVGVLNVAGPRHSEDPKLYADARKVLERALHMLADQARGKPFCDLEGVEPAEVLPGTIPEAVEDLIDALTPRERVIISRMEDKDLSQMEASLGRLVRMRLDLYRNHALKEACRGLLRGKVTEPAVTGVLIQELWKRLRASHTLRALGQDRGRTSRPDA